jgi:hypothetical protein
MAKSPHSIRFDKAAEELGLVCIYWAWLEQTLDELIIELAKLERGDIGRSVTANADIRPKISMTKALAFLRKPSDDWFSYALETLDLIDNNLRPRRNLFVHSGWYSPKGVLTRITRKTKLKRPQAFRLTLTTEEQMPIKLADVRRMKIDIIVAIRILVVLLASVMREDDERRPYIAKHPQQYLPEVRRILRRLRARLRQAPPPQS